jgi:alkylation response protein AidB-like acyl-CoA dehydrogenase
MRLAPTDAQVFLRRSVREFAEKEIGPRVRELDDKGEFPMDIWKRFGELGYSGCIIPKEYGGQGLDTVSYMIIVEEICRVEPGVGLALAVHNSVGCYPIYAWGTEEQRKRLLPDLCTGKLGGFAITEPSGGSDPAAMESTARLEGDHYILNGTKVFITNGNGDVFIVAAKTDKDKGVKGITTFILEKGMKGFKPGHKEDKMGLRTDDTTELIMEDVPVPKENVIGAIGGGFKLAMMALDVGRIGIGAQALGIAQGAYEEALKYSKTRKTFGKPIGEHQAVQFILADMAIEIEAARLLVHRAADLKDKGRPFSMEASMAKMFASDMAMRVVIKAIQVLGGHGYTKKHLVEKFFRDAKGTQIYEGTNEIQRLVIARALLY